MLDDLEQAALLLMRNINDDPQEIWNRLGIELEVVTTLCETAANFLRVEPRVALVLMEQGALLVEAAREHELS